MYFMFGLCLSVAVAVGVVGRNAKRREMKKQKKSPATAAVATTNGSS